MNALTINHTSIHQDSEGRYCLNDLHRAAVLAGSNKRTKEPGKFLEGQQTIRRPTTLSTSNATRQTGMK